MCLRCVCVRVSVGAVKAVVVLCSVEEPLKYLIYSPCVLGPAFGHLFGGLAPWVLLSSDRFLKSVSIDYVPQHLALICCFLL